MLRSDVAIGQKQEMYKGTCELCYQHYFYMQFLVNPLKPTVAIWVQL